MVIQNQNEVINFVLETDIISLKEVVIKTTKNKSKRQKQIEIFEREFLGKTENAQSCTIENKGILKFRQNETRLTAKSGDFLIIINQNLGYRIKYLLREFIFNFTKDIASFDGECIFEELDGTKEEQQNWKKNRELAYYGSWMHYLRSVYAETAEEQGFLTFLSTTKTGEPLQLDQNPYYPNRLFSKVDSNFIAYTVKYPIFIKYIKKTKLAEHDAQDQTITKTQEFSYNNGTIVRLLLDKALIDSKGNIVDYKSFLLQGTWGRKRISDKLPFEYVPEPKI